MAITNELRHHGFRTRTAAFVAATTDVPAIVSCVGRRLRWKSEGSRARHPKPNASREAGLTEIPLRLRSQFVISTSHLCRSRWCAPGHHVAGLGRLVRFSTGQPLHRAPAHDLIDQNSWISRILPPAVALRDWLQARCEGPHRFSLPTMRKTLSSRPLLVVIAIGRVSGLWRLLGSVHDAGNPWVIRSAIRERYHSLTRRLVSHVASPMPATFKNH